MSSLKIAECLLLVGQKAQQTVIAVMPQYIIKLLLVSILLMTKQKPTALPVTLL